MKPWIVAAVVLLLPAVARAQVNVDADFLTRGEIRKGGLASEDLIGEDGETLPPGYDFAGFIIERSRLSLQYGGDDLKAKLTAQHCGTWGSREGGSLNIYEAWFQYGWKGLFAKVGRQDLSYDDQRIFGSDDWSMTGMTHDVLKVGYEGYGHKVHLFAAYNQNLENMEGGSWFSGGLQPYKAMEAAWYHYDVPRFPLGASILFMNVGMQGGEKINKEITYQQQLVGTYVSFTPEKWSLEAAYYRQMGKEEHGIPIAGWMASSKVTLSVVPRFTFYSGYDYLSGDESFATPAIGNLGMARHETIRGFSSIYGSHHKFYGAMDFFYVTTYYGGFTPGLQNLFAGVKWAPGNFTVDASYHYLSTATPLKNAGMALGHEGEFSASYVFRKYISLSAGLSLMRGTETMELLKRSSGKRSLTWAWLMLTVSPTVFTSKR